MSTHAGFACLFTFTSDNRGVVIALQGKLDPEAVQELHPQVQEVYQAGVRRFVFDLSELSYLSSMGVRLLLGLRNQVKQDGQVVLCHPSAEIMSLVDMMKLNDIFPIYPTRAEAVAAISR